MRTDMFKDLSMRIFLGHLVAYVAVTLICAGVNLWLTPGTLWWPWVLMGWGIAVATHALALLLRKTHRRERIFIDKCARSFTVHLFAYVAVVLLLLLRQSHRDAEGVVVLLGGARLGRRRSFRMAGALSSGAASRPRQRRLQKRSRSRQGQNEIGHARETKPAQPAQQEP